MKRAAAASPDVRTFEVLVREVKETLLEGRRRIEQATVFGNWETGRLINVHILLNQHRADYATHVFTQLAQRTGISQRLLYQCSQFNRTFPNLHHGANLGWSHYRLLCQVGNPAARARLATEARRRRWTAPELEDRVRQLNLTAPASEAANGNNEHDSPELGVDTPKLLTPKRGTPGLYPVVTRPAGIALDLGFKMFLPLGADEVKQLRIGPGAIVRATDDGTLVPEREAARTELFTYSASEIRVIDGDTLAVTIALPPGREIDKKLRLRGINCPEMDTAVGRAAKHFVQALVDPAQSLVVTTTKPDKYDRYLADIHIQTVAGSESGEIFLNNMLLENGHAVRSDGSAPSDWIA
jgi:micrococcal nuclease